MSWAAQRKTKRVEDEAYCLMGLFGVNMPTNYGEGKRAFLRLQYEIMQHKECDMSLFAFGEPIMPNEIIRDGILFEGNKEKIDRDNPWQYLLADSPRQFRHSFRYIPDLGSNAIQRYPPPRGSSTAGPFDRIELPRATATSYGVKFRLPVAIVDDVTIAVILCQAGARHFGLFLTRDDRAKDPQRPRYFLGRGYTRSATGPAIYLARMCDLGGDLYNLTFKGKRVEASWSTIYLIPTATDLDSESATSPNLLINCDPRSRFQLPRWLVDRFTGLRFEVGEAQYSDTLQIIRIVHRSEGRIYLCIGKCTEQHRGPDNHAALWAKVFVTTLVSPNEFTHDCSKDHLDSESWAMRSRDFGDGDRLVRLSFAESRRKLPETAVVIHLELFGRRFREMLQGSGISFPSIADAQRELPCPIPETLLSSSRTPRFPFSRDETSGRDDDSSHHSDVGVSLSTVLQLQRLLSHLEEDFSGPLAAAAEASITPSQPGPSSPQIEDMESESTPYIPGGSISTLLQLQQLFSDFEHDLRDVATQQSKQVRDAPSQPGPSSPQVETLETDSPHHAGAPDIPIEALQQFHRLMNGFEKEFLGLTAQQSPFTASQPGPSPRQIETLETDSSRVIQDDLQNDLPALTTTQARTLVTASPPRPPSRTSFTARILRFLSGKLRHDTTPTQGNSTPVSS
uniref:N/A n=1 Tax=Ganoderma boninense TaxID=34458 RepID=A0A5K1JVR8_9APHY|nr:N/A [Ganoderma boninense]